MFSLLHVSNVGLEEFLLHAIIRVKWHTESTLIQIYVQSFGVCMHTLVRERENKQRSKKLW